MIGVVRRYRCQELIVEDELWGDQREPKGSVADRCDAFLQWLRTRPEQELAVVSHHHFLLVMFYVSLQCEDDEDEDRTDSVHSALLTPFGTGQLRSVVIEFA